MFLGMANLCQQIDRYEEAFNYASKSLHISEKLNSERDILSCYNELGEIFLKEGKHSVSVEYFSKSLDL